MWMVLFAWMASASECPEEPLGSLQEGAAAIEQTFIDLDEAGFDSAHAAVQRALPCVRAPLALRDVMGIHRSAAIAAFVEGDMVGARKSWGAVRALNPSWTPPDALAPPGHLLRELFDKAAPNDETVTLELAPEGGWVVDGRAGDAVPRDRAFVLQALDGDGQVVYTGYGRSVAEVPALDFARPGPSPRAKKMRVIASAVGGALALGAAGAAAMHFDARGQLGEVDYAKLDATRTRGNVAGWSAIGAGAAAVGVTTAGWLVRW